MEPSDAGVEAGCQGTLRAEIHLAGRRAHSARSWLGSNAIHSAADVLARLAEYQPSRVMIDGLEYREGLNAVGITGGVAGNVIPDECVVIVNYRFAPSLTPELAERHVRAIFEGFDVRIVDVAAGALPGLSQPAAKAFLEVTGSTPRPKFGWTDVARFTALGIPAVNYGPGDPSLAHTREEYVPTEPGALDLRGDARLARGSGPGRRPVGVGGGGSSPIAGLVDGPVPGARGHAALTRRPHAADPPVVFRSSQTNGRV